jgi:phage terminase large subunit-like protein
MTASLLEQLAALPVERRHAALAKLTEAEAAALMYNWRGFLARPAQVAPEGDWFVWLILAGRGSGKTRTGAEWVREEVDAGRAKRIALVAETAADARDVMVEGESGLLSIYPQADRPMYEPSKRRVTWRNGAVATLYNATEPDQLRGPQHDLAWGDEIAKWRYAQDAFDQLMFGLRLGLKPRALFTTTPRPIPIVRDLMKREGQDVVVTRGGTYDNRSNLAASFLKVMRDKYEGTRLGRQELFAEILDDVPGALWTRAMLDEHRVKPDEVPPLKRIVVAVDPAVTSDETSDEPGENGISVAGLGENNHAYVLDDASLIGSPRAWASRAVGMLDQHDADCIVVEINQGGDMVTSTLRSVRSTVRIKEVRASRGKHVRAEPVAALYEQGRVHHVGAFAALEDQMVLMTPQGYLGATSPDRLDALVWGLTDLFPAMIRPVRKEEPRPVSRSGVSWMAS